MGATPLGCPLIVKMDGQPSINVLGDYSTCIIPPPKAEEMLILIPQS